MAKVFILRNADINIKAIFKMIKNVAMENNLFQTIVCIKENFKMIKNVGKD